MTFSAIALVVLLVLTALQASVLTLFSFHARWARRKATRMDYPPVSILLPIRALEPGFERALESVYAQDYPDFEVVICAESTDLPVMDVARKVAARHPTRATRFFSAPDGTIHNPKIATLAPGLGSAAHDAILIRDSNIVLLPDQLRDLAARWIEPVGLVCAIPRAEAALGVAARLEQAVMNGRDAPYTLAAAAFGINVGYGKVMLFRRSHLDAIGGLSAIGNEFGDDHALACGLAAAGRTTVYAALPVSQPVGHKNLQALWSRQVRWMVIRRRQAVAAYLCEPWVGTPAAVAAALLAGPVLGVSPYPLACAVACWRLALETILLRLAGWPVSRDHPIMALIRDIVLLGVWVSALRARHVKWVGRSHSLPKAVGAPLTKDD